MFVWGIQKQLGTSFDYTYNNNNKIRMLKNGKKMTSFRQQQQQQHHKTFRRLAYELAFDGYTKRIAKHSKIHKIHIT